MSVKSIFAELLKTAAPKPIAIRVRLAELMPAVHIATAMKGKTFIEINALTERLFTAVANKLGCDIAAVTMISDTREGTHFEWTRLETPIEMSKRIQREAEIQFDAERRAKATAASDEKSRAKKIAQLQAELERLNATTITRIK